MKALLAFVVLALTIVPARGEDDKLKAKDGRIVVVNKSKPVRQALEAQYAKIAEAQKNEDIEALRRLRTPDFTVEMPGGETWDLEQSLNYSRRGFEQVEFTILISNTIESLDVHGDVAVAVVQQRWSRMQTKQGALRRVETTAVQRETWVETPDGWKLRLIDDIHPGAWYVDGKRVDPTKPYDPEAPPFEPLSE